MLINDYLTHCPFIDVGTKTRIGGVEFAAHTYGILRRDCETGRVFISLKFSVYTPNCTGNSTPGGIFTTRMSPARGSLPSRFYRTLGVMAGSFVMPKAWRVWLRTAPISRLKDSANSRAVCVWGLPTSPCPWCANASHAWHWTELIY